MEIYKEFSDAGMDMVPYYRLNQKYFSNKEIMKYYSRIKETCDNAGVNFSVCFDKSWNFKKFRYLWSNQKDCCCIKGMLDGFTKTAEDVRVRF